jgi:hypothetical protein
MSLSFAVTISDDCGAVGAAFGAGEQPALAPKCKSAKGFGGNVRQTDSSIAKATRKVVPAACNRLAEQQRPRATSGIAAPAAMLPRQQT